MGCQCVLVAALSEEGDSAAPVPPAPQAAGHGAQCGDLWDSMDSPGWDSTSGQYFLVAMTLDCLEQEITWQSMENEWDNNKFILFCLYFSVYLSYQCFRWKRINPVSFWYSDIPVCQLGNIFVILFIVIIMLFFSF